MASLPRTMRDEDLAVAEKWQDPRIRTLCQECGHPRSEHHAIYNAIAGDYIHTHCKDSSCGCNEYLERPAKNIPPPRRLTLHNRAKDLESRCRACGSPQANHVYLGPECVTACEMNWKMLDILRRNGVITTAKV